MSRQRNPRDTHRLVSEQYERFPYPAAEQDLSSFIANRAFQAGCPSRFFHLYWPFRERTGDLDILVAGCGTMQAPKFAVNLPNARLTAIDLCERSIEHTNALLKKHDIRNVETYRMPIEEIGKLDRRFDLVISTGVLHHLPDPARGLRALREVLRDDGSMYLMLYGKYGRDGVYYMQDLLRRLGLDAGSVDTSELAAIRQLIRHLPPYHPLAAKQAFFRNFDVGDEEIVDLFLHPQDRGYALPDIDELLSSTGMKLQTMLFRAHYAPRCCQLGAAALEARLAELDTFEQFSAIELFRAGSLMHFFIACKQERDDATFTIDLDSPDWKSLVPVPWPFVRQETVRVPPGYNAVLHSPLHQFADIHYPASAAEVAIFNLSNDRNSIAGIQEQLAPRYPQAANDETLRDFMRRMQDYDYLSFRGPSGA